MNSRSNFLKIVILFVIAMSSATGTAQLEKGDRILGWQVDMAENANYDLAYAFATEACMESVHVFFPWNFIESDLNTFTIEGIVNLDIINLYHPLNGIKAELAIPPVNTVAKEMPADLMDLPFDSPLVINRYKALLDTIFNHIPDLELTALNIGNENDIFFGTNEQLYVEFKAFLDEVVPYAQQLYFDLHGEELKVGTVCSFHGLTSPATSDLCALLNEGLNVISTTYYPLNGDFTMQAPTVIATDFTELVAMYPDASTPIHFTECGYSSSPACNSSEEQQATFFENLFSAWDDNYDNIKYITIFKSTDWSQAEVDTFLEYYGIDTLEFSEYLRSLGVRTWDNDGTNKLAYEQIKCALEARNWCAVACAIQSTNELNLLAGIDVYPNPTEHLLKVPEEYTSFRILNSNGASIIEGPLQSSTIDVSTLRAGVYVIIVSNETTSTLERFIKL